MDASGKEVAFWDYCKTCEHEKVSAGESPCNECLTIFVREGTEKPVKYKKAEKKSQKKQSV